MVKFTCAMLDIILLCMVCGFTTVGAVPFTAYTVNVLFTFCPNSDARTNHVFHVCANVSPFTIATPLIWKNPARFVNGPDNGGVFGVVL